MVGSDLKVVADLKSISEKKSQQRRTVTVKHEPSPLSSMYRLSVPIEQTKKKVTQIDWVDLCL